MFSNRNDLNLLLHDVCSLSKQIQSINHQSPNDIASFLESYITKSRLKQNEALFYFVYALTCDYFFTICRKAAFKLEANDAYMKAIAAYHNAPTELNNLQAYYRHVMHSIEKNYKHKLHNFLERLVRPDLHDGREPSMESYLQLIIELKKNLYCLNSKLKSAAVSLINAAPLAENELLINAELLNELNTKASHLYLLITIEHNCSDLLYLANRMASLKLDDPSTNALDSNQLGNLWLVRDLLTSTDIPNFISQLINTLQDNNDEIKSLKRTSSEDTSKQHTADNMEGIELFNRRIVYARRYAVITNETNYNEVTIDEKLPPKIETLECFEFEQPFKKFKF